MVDLNLFAPELYRFDLIDSLYIATGLLVFVLGAVVSVRERDNNSGRIYFLFTLSIAGWILSVGLMLAAQDPAIARVMVIASNIAVSIIPATFYYYTRVLLGIHRQQRLQIQLIGLCSLGFAMLAYLQLDFATPHLFSFGYYSLYGLTGYAFIAYFTLSISWAYLSFMRQVTGIRSNEHTRQRMRWISIALIIALIATTDFLPALGIDYHPFGGLFVLFLFIITTYVTLRYRLVDITAEYAAENLLHIIQSPLLIFDLDGTVRLFNSAAEKDFGVHDFSKLWARLQPLLESTLEGGRFPQPKMALELELEQADGMHEYDVTVSPIHSRQHALLAYTCLFTDITQMKHYQQALQAASEDLEQRVAARTEELSKEIARHKATVDELIMAKQAAVQANQAKTIFLSRMSHELRTPMNAILGFSDLMRGDFHNIEPEDQQDYIHNIYDAGKHLMQLIDDILDLSRIELDRLQLHMQSLSLEELLKDCCSLIASQAEAKQIAIHIEESSCYGQHIRADRTRIKQVILNLLSNAVKYNHPQGSIHIYCETLEHTLRLNIQDSGIGIPSELSDKVFLPFERLANIPQGIDGVGIGLALSKRLLELQGGEIGFCSELGVGSRFWLQLPTV